MPMERFGACTLPVERPNILEFLQLIQTILNLYTLGNSLMMTVMGTGMDIQLIAERMAPETFLLQPSEKPG